MSELETDIFTVQELVAFKNRAAIVRKKHDLTVTALRSWAGDILGRTIPKVDTLQKAEWEKMLAAMESKDPPPQPDTFCFNLNDWRRAANLPPNFSPPSDAAIELVVDPSWTVANWSDKTGMAVGYKAYREVDGGNELTLLHAFSDRLEWTQLIDTIASTALQFNVSAIRIERNHIGPTDLLVASVKEKLREKSRGEISVVTFKPDRAFQAKRRRIQRLQIALDANPPLLRFCYYAPFINALFDEVSNFIFEKDKKRDRSREDSMLDAISLLFR